MKKGAAVLAPCCVGSGHWRVGLPGALRAGARPGHQVLLCVHFTLLSQRLLSLFKTQTLTIIVARVPSLSQEPPACVRGTTVAFINTESLDVAVPRATEY